MKNKLKSILNNNRNSGIIAGIILAIMLVISILSSVGAFGIPGDSGTTDEVAHIPSGYSYVKYHDFRLNPEHPPLAKALAGIPLALNKNIQGPINDWSWNGIAQWEAGWYMIYEAGNDPAEVLFWARLPMMLLMIGLGVLIFIWSRKLFGNLVAIVILIMYAFYPDVIAHGRLVTTDIAAAFGYVLSMYFFDKALREKKPANTIWAGVAFGIAQLLKFSSFLLFGIFIILGVIRAILDRKTSSFGKELWKAAKIYFWTCFISIIVVWIVYIPFVWKTPPSVEHELIDTNLTTNPKTLPHRNFLHLLEGNIILRAIGHYLLGMMLVVLRVAGGNATYILGHLSDKSISWYFPVAWLIKTSISVIILFISSIVYFFSRKKDKEILWTGLLLLTPIVVYWAFTLKGSLNIGIRHLIPTVPFVLLFIGFIIKAFLESKSIAQKLIIWILVIYMIISTMSYYPYFIGYFNEAVPREKRHDFLIDSSLDWGQDVLRLQKYINDNDIKSIKVDYFGGSVPSYYIPQAKKWHSSYGPTSGWLAVSATFYQSSKLYGPMEGKWSYSWLDKIEPTAIIGGSILVYNISPQYLIDNPPISPYKIHKIDTPESIK